MSENLKIYEAVRKVPEEAKKSIGGGRLRGMTDINPMWRIKGLTELFGPCGEGWYYKPVSRWEKDFKNGETAVFVEIELFYKLGETWSAPVYGVGGSMVGSNERSGFYVNDEAYKMATTDAISVACKNLGVGADVYFERDTTKYTDVQMNSIQQAPQISQMPQTQQEEEALLRELHEASEAEAVAEEPKRLTPKEQVRERLRTLDAESAKELCQPITPQEVQILTQYAGEMSIPLERIVGAYEKGRPENLTKAEYANAVQNLMQTKERLEKRSRVVVKGE